MGMMPQAEVSGRPRLLSIDEIVDAKAHRPAATTRERGWTGVTVDLYRAARNCAKSYPALDHHLISYCPSGSARLIQRRSGIVHEGLMSAGMSVVMPAGLESTWDGDAAASARLRIPHGLIVAAGEQLGHRGVEQIEILNIFETRDPLIEHMALILLGELNRAPHPTQALIVDQVSCALAAHMLRAYNGFDTAAPCALAPLGHAEMARLTEYIEDNIDRTIGLAELAAIVNVSRFHFTRLFKRSTGLTAISYVERCRILRAQSLIAETDFPLAEIALMTGFADQSHFTRRFHRHTGCTPAAFARDHSRRRSARRRLD